MNKFIVLLFVGLVYLPFLHAQEIIFAEENGNLVFEVEETQSSLGSWVKKTDNPGYQGACHFEFTGNTINGGAASSPLTFKLQITNPGKYGLVIRARKRLEGAESDKCNDGYVKLEGDFTSGNATPINVLTQYTKLFGGPANGWGWATTLDVGHIKYAPVYDLKAGIYTFYLAGRSIRWNVDRIAFFNKSMGKSAPSQTFPATPILGKCDIPGCYDFYTVNISEPEDSFLVYTDEKFVLKTNIGGTGLGLGSMKYYIDDELVYDKPSLPFRYTIYAKDFVLGRHTVRTELISAEGKSFLSDTVSFTVLNALDKTYLNECETYEEQKGLRRIGTKEGGFCLSYSDSLDWVSYLISAPKEGTYGFILRHATAIDNTKINFSIDGKVIHTLSPQVTGGTQNWENSEEFNLNLKEGEQELKIEFAGPDVSKYLSNINWFKYWYKYPVSVKTSKETSDYKIVNSGSALTIIPQDNIDNYSIRIFDLKGRIVNSIQNLTSEYILFTADEKQGIFILSLQSRNKIESTKIVLGF